MIETKALFLRLGIVLLMILREIQMRNRVRWDSMPIGPRPQVEGQFFQTFMTAKAKECNSGKFVGRG